MAKQPTQRPADQVKPEPPAAPPAKRSELQQREEMMRRITELVLGAETYDIQIENGIREKTKPLDEWRSYEVTGGRTITIKVNGGA